MFSFLSCSLRQVKRIIRHKGLRRRRQSSGIVEVVDAIEVSRLFLFITQPYLNLANNFFYISYPQQEELTGSGSCVDYRQMHQRLRNDHGLVVTRY